MDRYETHRLVQFAASALAIDEEGQRRRAGRPQRSVAKWMVEHAERLGWHEPIPVDGDAFDMPIGRLDRKNWEALRPAAEALRTVAEGSGAPGIGPGAAHRLALPYPVARHARRRHPGPRDPRRPAPAAQSLGLRGRRQRRRARRDLRGSPGGAARPAARGRARPPAPERHIAPARPHRGPRRQRRRAFAPRAARRPHDGGGRRCPAGRAARPDRHELADLGCLRASRPPARPRGQHGGGGAGTARGGRQPAPVRAARHRQDRVRPRARGAGRRPRVLRGRAGRQRVRTRPLRPPRRLRRGARAGRAGRRHDAREWTRPTTCSRASTRARATSAAAPRSS